MSWGNSQFRHHNHQTNHIDGFLISTQYKHTHSIICQLLILYTVINNNDIVIIVWTKSSIAQYCCWIGQTKSSGAMHEFRPDHSRQASRLHVISKQETTPAWKQHISHSQLGRTPAGSTLHRHYMGAVQHPLWKQINKPDKQSLESRSL